jgi:hypothetical protein
MAAKGMVALFASESFGAFCPEIHDSAHNATMPFALKIVSNVSAG